MAQIGTIRLQTQNNGTVDVPVFDTGDSGSSVYEFVRVQTAGGTGFIPVVDPADASYPYLRVQSQNQGIVAVHNKASLEAATDTIYFLDGATVWEYPSEDSLSSIAGSIFYQPPRLDDQGRLYVANDDGGVTRITVSDLSVDATNNSSYSDSLDAAVDSSYNMYVGVGSNIGTGGLFSWDESGNLRWSNETNFNESPQTAPSSITLDGNGNIYANSDNGYVQKIDASDGSQIWSASLGGSLSYTPAGGGTDGTDYYTTSDDDELWKIDGSDGSEIMSPAINYRAGPSDYHPQTNEFIVINDESNEIISYDPDTFDENWRTTTNAGNEHVSIATDGKIVASGGTSDTYILNADGSVSETIGSSTFNMELGRATVRYPAFASSF